jgi:hypothetical protein
MKVGVMQPYLFPYIGYWQLINAVDKYVIYDDVNFINRGWINRNNILMNGESKLINLKLSQASQNKLINEIEVFDDSENKEKLLKTIETFYRKAPYFSKVYPMIEDIVDQKDKNLARYIEYSLRQICKYLSIETELIISSSLNKDNTLRGQDKILNICKMLGADEYINAIGGQELYDYESFKNQGIELKFLKSRLTEYKQFKNEFVPNLSIIDVMMFNEVSNIKEMLLNYDLL